MKIDKKKIIFGVGIIVSAVSIWLFASNIEWETTKSSLKEANYLYVIPAILISVLVMALRSLRWQSILSPIKKVPFMDLFSINYIGFMANSVLPARAGEIIRPLIVSKKDNIKMTSTLTTVVLERIFDMLGLLIFTIVILAIIPTESSHKQHNIDSVSIEQGIRNGDASTPGEHTHKNSFLETLKKWIGIFAGAGIAAITFLSLFVFIPTQLTRISHKLFSIFPLKISKKLNEFLDSFISGLQILGNKWHVAWIFLLTIGIWLCIAGSIYVLSFSFNLNLPFTGACLVSICIAFAVALPQAPGYIGVFHLATQKTLEIFNVELASSQSYAITLWVVSTIPIIIIGFFFLWKEGLSFKDLSKIEEKNT